MSFIQNLRNNNDWLLGLGGATLEMTKGTVDFVKENKEEIKSVFEEIKEDAKAKVEERKENPHPLSLGLTDGVLGVYSIPSVFDYTSATMQNENAKDLVSDYWNDLKDDVKTWAKEKTLIGDIVNYFNKDKNIEAEG